MSPHSISSRPSDDRLIEDEANRLNLLREKSAHISKAARSATTANFLAPLLCIPMFRDEVTDGSLEIWIGYMLVAVMIRTWLVYQLEYKAKKIVNPEVDLVKITFAVGIVGVGWGMGWLFIAPQLGMLNHMIYIYGTTAAMISSMFAYSVHKTTFYTFNVPIMLPSLFAVLVSGSNTFTWPFSVGLASLYIVVLGIAKNFSQTFEDTVRLRFRNERLYQALANERDQSVAANVAKSRFIAVASHDLRQPMHAVNVYLELVNFDNLPPAEKNSLQKIKSSIATLNTMFDSLLNISKLDAAATPVNPRIFHLREWSATLRDLYENKAKSKVLTFHITAPDLVVRGDKLLLQQIVGNLISNAIQYTETGGIDVCFASENECLQVEVSDTGCGISEADQENIFNEFFRADTTRALHDGLGLGLSIVKRLCQMIEANIRVVSTVGEGSRFILSTSFSCVSKEDDPQHTHASLSATSAERGLQGKSIAIIEDNPIIVEAYRQVLTSKGAHVYVLSELDDELDAQLESIDHLDGILSDFRLSQTTGDVLIQKLRENFNAEIPAIIVTADTSPAHITMFDNLNVQVLHKPISFHEVALAIEKIITP